jgi:hypothetical protein
VEQAASGSHWPMNYASYGKRRIVGMWRADVAAAGESVDGFLSGYLRCL